MKKYLPIDIVLLAFMMAVLMALRIDAPDTKALDVATTEVQVTVCGDGAVEGFEECDDGSQCSNGVQCTDDAECAGIGDNLCSARNGDGCSDQCLVETGGGGSAPTNVLISQITAYPEQRSGTAGTNYDMKYFFSVLNSQNHQSLYSHSSLVNGKTNGKTSIGVQVSSTPGTYDVALKSNAHLTRIQDNVFLGVGNNVLNFTHPNNLPTIGSIRLIAGDIDGSGTGPSNLGDDVINAIDLSILLDRHGNSDIGGNNRANLNQDNVIDDQDLTILVGNLDLEGDK